VYHAGDYPLIDTDWGLRQMDAVRDVDKGAWGGLFLVATTFGDHLLHHLFPTVDHSKLHFLYPALEETCKDFGDEYRFESAWKMFVGMHTQLARTQKMTFTQRQRMRNDEL
jgi:fatty acid desaturase